MKTLLGVAAVTTLGCGSMLGGSFSANFNDYATPAGSSLAGSTVIEAYSASDANGVCKLTKNVNSLQGAFVIGDLDVGATDGVNSFDVTFKVRSGGGTATPADGWSFCVANNLPTGSTWGEEGTGNGLTVSFDIYVNGNVGETTPTIDIKWGGVVLSSTAVTIDYLRTGTELRNVRVKMDPDGTLDVMFKDNPIVTNLQIPGFAPIVGALYGWGARTGGLNENQWIDDVNITTTTGPLQLAFSQQPANIRGMAGRQVTLRSVVNDPASVQGYQWYKKAPGAPAFGEIFGATGADYTTDILAVADDGTQFQVIATGLNNNATSVVATLSVVSIVLPTATVSYNFDDGLVPAGTSVFGTAAVTADGGVGNSGTLRLTEAANDQNGAFVIPDQDGGQAVDSLVAVMQLQIGPGTARPADGFSFSWANDVPGGVITGGAEEGAGSGLRVAFDVWDSGGGEAPAIDLKWGNTVLASRKMSIPVISPGAFVEVIIRLKADGTADVVHNGEVLHWNVPVPGWSTILGGRFMFAARTGGANEAHYVDEIALTTTLFTGPVMFTRQPANTTVVVGYPATFTIEVNDPDRSTYQWQRKAPGAASFADIPEATSASYTTAATVAGDDGTQYRCVATGPRNTATSDAATLSVFNITRPTTCNVNFNFDDGVTPAGTAIFGNAAITVNGGVGDSGVLHLTDAAGSQNGAFILDNFNGVEAISSFTAAFDLRVGGGSTPPADGYSFSVGPDIPNGTVGEAENGTGNGLVVSFDTYDNVDADPNNGVGEAPAVEIKWGGLTIATNKVPLSALRTDGDFKTAIIRVSDTGLLDVVIGSTVLYRAFPLPGYAGSYSGLRWALMARTGGATDNHWIDNLCIATVRYFGPLFFLQHPASVVVVPTATPTFSATVSDPSRVISYQWQQKLPGSASFVNIVGATDPTYTTAPLAGADNGTQLRVVVNATGGVVLNSDPATITVVDIRLDNPTALFDFNDGLLPAGTVMFGNSAITAEGGVDNSGVLRLTEAIGGQMSSFIVNDLNGGARVRAAVIAADVQLCCNGGNPPADGFSINWADDISDGVFGEDGAGSGLIVSVDTWDNGGGEAPAIDLLWQGERIAPKRVPIALIATDPGQYVQVIVRVSQNGYVDVVYDKEVVHYQVKLSNYTGMAGTRFALGARTGGAFETHYVDNLYIETGVPPAPLTITRGAGGTFVVTFEGTLQSAPSITGPFTPVAGATPPSYTVPAGGPPMLFFRSVRP